MIRRAGAILLLAALTACAGADGGSTPRDAAAKFVDAFTSGDAATAQRLVVGSPDEFRALEAMMRFLAEGRAFRDRMIEAYGEAGWKSFNDTADAHLRLPSPADLDIPKAEIEVVGPVAHVRIDGRGVMRLERRDDRWYFPLDQWMGGDVGRATRQFEATTRCVLEFGERIGKPGESAESIDAAMAPALVLASRMR